MKARNVRRASSEVGRGTRNTPRNTRKKFYPTIHFFLSLFFSQLLFPSIFSFSFQLRFSAKPRNVYAHCVRYRQVSMMPDRNDRLRNIRGTTRVHNNERESTTRARSFRRCVFTEHCEHSKRCTSHVTLPYLRCDHIIPEINTRVTLSHERRAVGATVITDW